MTNQPTPHDDHGCPPELRGVETMLDALGEADRRATPPGLAERIAAATASELPSSADDRPTVVGRIGFGSPVIWGAGLAAAAAIATTIAVTLPGTTPMPANDDPVRTASTELEADVEAFTLVAAIFEEDDWSESWSGDLDRIGEQAEELDAALDDEWNSIGSWIDDDTGSSDT